MSRRRALCGWIFSYDQYWLIYWCISWGHLFITWFHSVQWYSHNFLTVAIHGASDDDMEAERADDERCGVKKNCRTYIDEYRAVWVSCMDWWRYVRIDGVGWLDYYWLLLKWIGDFVGGLQSQINMFSLVSLSRAIKAFLGTIVELYWALRDVSYDSYVRIRRILRVFVISKTSPGSCSASLNLATIVARISPNFGP